MRTIKAEDKAGNIVEIEYSYTPAGHGDPCELEIVGVTDESGEPVDMSDDEAVECMEKRALRGQF